jgi:hypothetical protein
LPGGGLTGIEGWGYPGGADKASLARYVPPLIGRGRQFRGKSPH